MIPADKTVLGDLTVAICVLDRRQQFAGIGLSLYLNDGMQIAIREALVSDWY